MEVARSAISGGYAADRRLMPTPRTTWWTPSTALEASASTPASLRDFTPPIATAPSTMTSLGHLRDTGSPVAARIPSAAATPPASVSSGTTRGSRNTTEMYSPAPGGENHFRPNRPRPSDCAQAMTVAPSGAPRSASAAATSFVDVVSKKKYAGSPNGPRRSAVALSAAYISAGSASDIQLQLEAQIGRRRRVRQRANRHVVGAGAGELRDALQRHPARNLDLRAPTDLLDGLPDLVGREIVEQDDVG